MQTISANMLTSITAHLSRGRVNHTLRVIETAGGLAEAYGEDVHRSELAACLHDIAKELAPADMLASAYRCGVVPDLFERQSPGLLHARVGAAIAKTVHGIEDPEVLSAIADHTLGRPGMPLLSQILFVADVTEPGRPEAMASPARNALNQSGLGAAIAVCCKHVVSDLLSRGQAVHPTTLATYNWFRASFPPALKTPSQDNRLSD